MDFKEDFAKIVRESESSDSLYNAFVELCSKSLPDNAYERYLRLKSRNYIANDEIDVNVYVKNVANKHRPKFNILYSRLFEKYSNIFTDCVDLVVWGCGCGLDLLALYDQASKERNPNFWLAVKTITLVDISKAAIDRAEQIAEVLFPSCRIKKNVANLRDKDSLGNITLESSLVVVPRIHLFSNLLDIFSETELDNFSEMVRSVSSRKENVWNDVFIAFSPNIPNANVKQKMERFKSSFRYEGLHIKPFEFIIDADKPDRCECVAFSLREDCSCFRSLDFNEDNFFKRLRKIAVNEIKAWPWYDVFNYFADDKRREKALPRFVISMRCTDRENKVVDCLVIIPPKEQRSKLFIVSRKCFTKNEKFFIAKKVFERVVSSVEDEELSSLFCEIKKYDTDKVGRNPSYRMFEFLNIEYWNDEKACPCMDENDTKYKISEGLLRELDFTGVCYVNTGNIEPLPALSRGQRDIVDRRKQYLRVRGGPGTGKTVTMLWRAIEVFKRTHLPILLLCKTNSLIAYHEKVLHATLKSDLDLVCLERTKFDLDTVDGYLCKQTQCNGECKIKGKKSSSMEMNVLCDECRIARNQKIKGGEWQSSRKYGAVLLDEAQIIESESVRMVYELTRRANPYRDFYMFCDEEQAMRGSKDILEDDLETKKRVVKAPDKGFGRFVTLKSHYRALNEDLLKVFKFIQGKLGTTYDIKELGMELSVVNMQPSLAIHVAFAVACKKNVDLGDWEQWIKPDLDGNSDGGDVLLMIDEEMRIRQFYKEIKGKGSEEEKRWVVTHKEVRNREEEKILRRSFYKDRDKTHLSTVDCAQGQTFDNVVLVVTHSGNMEELFSGMTRARKTLRIIDASPNRWVYGMLKIYNSYEMNVIEAVPEQCQYNEPEEMSF